MRSRPRRNVVLSSAAFITALLVASCLSPAAVDVARAQNDRAATMLESRIPSSDSASDYVQDRLDAATAAAAAAAASAEPPAETSAEPAPESTGEPAPETTAESAEAPPTESKDGSAPAESKDAAAEPPAGAAPDGSNGTTTTLSGSDVVVSSVGESNQVDRPGRRDKNRR